MELNGKHILVVDDDARLRQLMRVYLEHENATVDEAGNGAMAFQPATMRQPDLIVMDLNMPDMNGFESIRSLRMVLEDTPVLVVSGYDTDDNFAAACEAGADECMSKPIDRAAFLAAVRRLLDKARPPV